MVLVVVDILEEVDVLGVVIPGSVLTVAAIITKWIIVGLFMADHLGPLKLSIGK